MADTVRSLMEAMVPELEDYERRGYFSKTEIGSIVQRRQQFEYNLRRRNALVVDFLRCGVFRGCDALLIRSVFRVRWGPAARACLNQATEALPWKRQEKPPANWGKREGC